MGQMIITSNIESGVKVPWDVHFPLLHDTCRDCTLIHTTQSQKYTKCWVKTRGDFLCFFFVIRSKSGCTPLFENPKRFESRSSSLLFGYRSDPGPDFESLGPLHVTMVLGLLWDKIDAFQNERTWCTFIMSSSKSASAYHAYKSFCQTLFSSWQALSNDFTCGQKLWLFDIIPPYRCIAKSPHNVMLIWTIHNDEATPCCAFTVVCKLRVLLAMMYLYTKCIF